MLGFDLYGAPLTRDTPAVDRINPAPADAAAAATSFASTPVPPAAATTIATNREDDDDGDDDDDAAAAAAADDDAADGGGGGSSCVYPASPGATEAQKPQQRAIKSRHESQVTSSTPCQEE